MGRAQDVASRMIRIRDRVEMPFRREEPSAQAIPGISSSVQQFRYKSMDADHVVCRSWDGTTEGNDDVLVAKPYLLRRTPFDGQSRGGISYDYSSNTRRVADDGDATETQVVVPSFVIDDILYAVSGVVGGTDVADATLLDINVDGRAWAQEDSG